MAPRASLAISLHHRSTPSDKVRNTKPAGDSFVRLAFRPLIYIALGTCTREKLFCLFRLARDYKPSARFIFERNEVFKYSAHALAFLSLVADCVDNKKRREKCFRADVVSSFYCRDKN
jgi:hypothetical protein